MQNPLSRSFKARQRMSLDDFVVFIMWLKLTPYIQNPMSRKKFNVEGNNFFVMGGIITTQNY